MSSKLEEAILEAYKEDLVNADFVVEAFNFLKKKVKDTTPENKNDDKTILKFGEEALNIIWRKRNLPKDTRHVRLYLDKLKTNDPGIAIQFTYKNGDKESAIHRYCDPDQVEDVFKEYDKVKSTINSDVVIIDYDFIENGSVNITANAYNNKKKRNFWKGC